MEKIIKTIKKIIATIAIIIVTIAAIVVCVFVKSGKFIVSAGKNASSKIHSNDVGVVARAGALWVSEKNNRKYQNNKTLQESDMQNNLLQWVKYKDPSQSIQNSRNIK